MRDNNHVKVEAMTKDVEHAGDLIQDVAALKPRKSFFCSKFKRIICVMASLAAIVTSVILVAIFANTLFKKDDTPSQQAWSQHHAYDLFATKTMYTTAYNNLAPSGSLPMPLASTLPIDDKPQDINHNRNIYHHHHLNFKKNSNYLPRPFSHETLNSLHQRLVSDGCSAKHIYFVGRHAARYPSTESMIEQFKVVESVKSRIHLSINSPDPQVNEVPLAADSAVTKSELLVRLKNQWTPYAPPDVGDLITPNGMVETINIARRLKQLYPDLFSLNKSNVIFGVTDEHRTGQTAYAFMKNVDGMRFDYCGDDQLSILPNGDDMLSYANVKNSPCLARLTREHSHLTQPKLHSICEKFAKKKTTKRILSEFEILKNSSTTSFIADSVSKRLELSDQDRLTSDEAYQIYEVCRFETGIKGFSDWCNVFSKEELKFYEYIRDINYFYNDAYGEDGLKNSGCHIKNDIIHSFVQALELNETRSTFFFSHSEVLQRLIASLVDLDSQEGYSQEAILQALKTKTVPETRDWQTSLLTPFSSNLAFTLYECPKDGNVPLGNDAVSNSFFGKFDMTAKLIVSLNEKPIKLLDSIGDISPITLVARMFNVDCDLSKICKTRTTFI